MWGPGFDPWIGKIPWRRERLPTLVFWPGELHGQLSPCDHKELDTTERLSLSLFTDLIKQLSAQMESACPLVVLYTHDHRWLG